MIDKLSHFPKTLSSQRLWIIGLLLTCLALSSCSANSESDGNTAVSPELEAQVLQIVRQNPEVILEAVEAYRTQQQDETRQVRQDFLKQMMENPAKSIGDSPTTGSDKQEIVLLEFSDFQCPYCAKAHETVTAFMEKYGDRVTLSYKNLPLSSIHPEALPAAKAAWAAGKQGKFWEYRSALFAKQKDLGDDLYGSIAQELSLDEEQFDRDRQSDAAQAAIDKDLAVATSLGLNGTPVFFLNEEALSGAVELSALEAALERVSKDR
ncbi:MAG: thioredoxin domain-containing protein [Geitlerinemataceae cyanobacterium]